MSNSRSRRRHGLRGAQSLTQVVDLVVDLLALCHESLDLLDRMDHGGVVPAAEEAGDRGVAEIGLLAEDVHRHLAGGDELALAALATEGLDREAEVVADL